MEGVEAVVPNFLKQAGRLRRIHHVGLKPNHQGASKAETMWILLQNRQVKGRDHWDVLPGLAWRHLVHLRQKSVLITGGFQIALLQHSYLRQC